MVLAATGAELGVSDVAVLAALAVEEGVLGAGEIVGLLRGLEGLVDLVAVATFELLVWVIVVRQALSWLTDVEEGAAAVADASLAVASLTERGEGGGEEEHGGSDLDHFGGFGWLKLVVWLIGVWNGWRGL